MLNIDDFCRDTAKTLLTLFARFPIKTAIYVEDICGPDTPDEFGLHSTRHLAGFNTLLWLSETGYIQFSQTIKQDAVDECTLTHRSLLLLNSICTFENVNSPLSQKSTQEIQQDKNVTAEKFVQTRMESLKKSINHDSSDTLTRKVLSYFEIAQTLK